MEFLRRARQRPASLVEGEREASQATNWAGTTHIERM